MANRRMFSLDVVDTDKFLDMPVSTQCLYFHLGMRADDEGFVSSPRKIIKLLGCSNDDLKLLIAKEYLIPFNDGVVVIVDWNVNNWIRPDRKHNTRFQAEKQTLALEGDRYNLVTDCQTIDNQLTTERHTEVRLGKDSIDKDNINTLCSELKASEPESSGILLPLNDKSFYDVPLDKIALWKETYPAVDVEQELKRMTAWLDSNPARRKTKRGITRFINSWLSREQDRGGTYKNSERNQKADVEAALARHRSNIEPPECEDGPFQ